MKIVLFSAAIWVAISPFALAQTGGYPASPSHGVVGPPKPDGSLRYGSEPAKDANPANTVGSTGPVKPDDRSGQQGPGDADKNGGRTPQGADKTVRH